MFQTAILDTGGQPNCGRALRGSDIFLKLWHSALMSYIGNTNWRLKLTYWRESRAYLLLSYLHLSNVCIDSLYIFLDFTMLIELPTGYLNFSPDSANWTCSGENAFRVKLFFSLFSSLLFKTSRGNEIIHWYGILRRKDVHSRS